MQLDLRCRGTQTTMSLEAGKIKRKKKTGKKKKVERV